MRELTIIKIGGNVVEKPMELESFLKKFSNLPQPKILVHGGGNYATELSAKLGIKVTMLDGRRITDAETLKLVTMVYAGMINKTVVSLLQKFGCNAIGLSGADGDIIPGVRRSSHPIDWGLVGDIQPSNINTSLLSSLMGRGLVPVFCPITHDRNGSLLNTNADTVASSLAVALSSDYSVRLIYCFEKEGVLSDPENKGSLMPLITRETFTYLQRKGAISHGMIPKLENAFSALENGVSEVVIKSSANLGNEVGTLLK